MAYYLKIEGIEGEGTDKYHEGWITIYAYRWGVSRQMTTDTGIGYDRESSNPKIDSLTLQRKKDKSSMGLKAMALAGKPKDIIMHLTKTGAGGGADVYCEYELEACVVCGFSEEGNSETNEYPDEVIKINFRSIQERYTEYDDRGNSGKSYVMKYNNRTRELS